MWWYLEVLDVILTKMLAIDDCDLKYVSVQLVFLSLVSYLQLLKLILSMFMLN